MRLDRLEISGFFHFPAPAVLDLRQLPAGLIALVGRNGEGKTRFLDAGPGSLYGPGAPNAPHLAFPSREHTLAEYATERAAYMETLWDVDGAAYRVRVNVDGQQRDTKAVLEEVLPDGRRLPLNDGKTSTFKEAVARIFPTRRQLLASAFAAQGKQGSFVALDQRGRMELFAELCDLGHYAAKAAAAGRCATAAEKARAALLAAREVIARDAGEPVVRALHDQRDALAAAYDAAAAERGTIQADLARLAGDRARWTDEAQQYLVAVSRLTAAERDLAGRRADLDLARRQGPLAEQRAAEQRAEAGQRRADLRTRLNGKTVDAKTACARTVADLERRIDVEQAILDQADEISLAAQERADDEETLAALREEEARARRDLEACRLDLVDADRHVAAVAVMRRQLAAEQEQVDALAGVPCGGVGIYAACRFLTRAAEARDRIPGLAAEVAEEAALLVVQAVAAERVVERRAATEAVAGQIMDVTARVAANAKAKLLPQVEAAEERIAGHLRAQAQARETAARILAALEEQGQEADAELATAEAAIEGRLAARVEELAAERARLEAAIAAADGTRQEAAAEAERTGAAKGRLDDAERALAAARAAETANAAALARAEAGLEAVDRQLAAVARKRADLERVGLRLEAAGQELVSWQLLAKAYGRDGLPKLEVDAAGPTVSNLCNDLLLACYGARFAVEVVTQVKRADGKGLKEEFAVLVADNEHGGEPRDVGDLSGGERVVVEEALRSAIALFVNAQARRPILTMWRDETTGALDPANVPRYVAMLRRIQQLGGVHQILFVTHSPEAAALADAQVRVEGGQPTVVLAREAA